MKIFLLFSIACVVASSEKTCIEKMQNTIMPRFAESTDKTTSLKITYLGGNKVECGNYMSFFDTLCPPTIQFNVPCRCQNRNVTVLFIGIPYNIYDTDMIVGYPYRHWLIFNVPEKVLRCGFRGEVGNIMTDYLPPINPFSDHQYTFFIFCQNANQYIEVKKKENCLLFDRPSFNPKDLAEKYGFGHPLAINYFVSSLVKDKEIPPNPGPRINR